MNRWIAILGLGLLFGCGAAWGETIELTTSDPNHPGWVDLSTYTDAERADYKKRADPAEERLIGKENPLRAVSWTPVSTDCVPCQALVAQYNGIMRGLLAARYSLRMFHYASAMRGSLMGELVPFIEMTPLPNGDYSYPNPLRLQEQQKRKEAVIKELATVAQKLRSQIAKCEEQCKKSGKKTTGIQVGGLPAIKGTGDGKPVKLPKIKLPFAWNGPYPAVCFRCAKLAQRLNNLRDWATERQWYLWGYDKATPHFRGEQARKAAEDLRIYKDNFAKTLKLYNQCIKECPKKVSYCPDPAANEAVAIGANADVGSGAKLEQRLTDAFGMGGSPFGGSIGGGFGGGPPAGTGGGSGPEVHPDKVPDAVKQEFVDAATGLALLVGGAFDPMGLMTSITLNNAPGDGTFQTVFIEDAQGRRGKPIGYWIISIYSDWSITVSWSYTRWVDGEVVEHREGGWSDEGSELLSRYSIPVFGEGLWKEMGFSNAVKGVKGLNALFPVSAERLAFEPMYLVVHVTEPDKDPVTTIPMIIKLGVDDAGKLTMTQVAATQADQDCEGKPRQKPQGSEQIEGGDVKPQPKPKPRSKLDQDVDDVLDAF